MYTYVFMYYIRMCSTVDRRATSSFVYTSFTPRPTVLIKARHSVRTMLKRSSGCWNTVIGSLLSTVILKLGSKAPLKKPRNLSLEPQERIMTVWLTGLEWLKMISRCLLMVIGEEQQATARWTMEMLAWYEESLKENFVSPNFSAGWSKWHAYS
jgi:hypothetical protein